MKRHVISTIFYFTTVNPYQKFTFCSIHFTESYKNKHFVNIDRSKKPNDCSCFHLAAVDWMIITVVSHQCHDVSNHQQLVYFSNRKETSKLHATVHLWRESTGGFPLQRASNTESISMPWHYHGWVPFGCLTRWRTSIMWNCHQTALRGLVWFGGHLVVDLAQTGRENKQVWGGSHPPQCCPWPSSWDPCTIS